jgi:hypothetical protein
MCVPYSSELSLLFIIIPSHIYVFVPFWKEFLKICCGREQALALWLSTKSYFHLTTVEFVTSQVLFQQPKQINVLQDVIFHHQIPHSTYQTQAAAVTLGICKSSTPLFDTVKDRCLSGCTIRVIRWATGCVNYIRIKITGLYTCLWRSRGNSGQPCVSCYCKHF